MTIYRTTPQTQATDLRNQEGHYLPKVETAFDKLTLMVQEQGEILSRAIIVDITSTETVPTPSELLAAETAAIAAAAAAATSETNAAASETAAGSSETNAAASETAAGLSETAAGLSETAAETAETNAAASETAAETAETNAAASAAAAAASETAAETAETNAETAETNADASETAAAASAAAAAASAAAVNTNTKASVSVISTANLTLSGVQTIDSYAGSANDRVCAAGQTDPVDNGIYVMAAGAWSRSDDMDEPSETLTANFYVDNGTNYADTKWIQTGDVATIGVDDIVFVQTETGVSVDTAANWTSSDPTLSVGAIGYESDTHLSKVGDGSTAWTSLAYMQTRAQQNGPVGIGVLPADMTATGLEIVDKGGIQFAIKESTSATVAGFYSNRAAGLPVAQIVAYNDGVQISGIYTRVGTTVDDGYMEFLTAEGGASSVAMRIAQDGKVGIGTIPDELSHISGASANLKLVSTSGAAVVQIRGASDEDADLRLYNSSVMKWRFGNDVSVGNYLRVYDSSDSSRAVHIIPGGTSWVTGSDSRLKDNIRTMGSRLTDVLNIKVREWDNYKEGIGFVAQELYECIPEAVSVCTDEIITKEKAEEMERLGDEGKLLNPWGVSRDFVIPALVKAFQEYVEMTNKRIEQLEAA